MKLSKVKDSEKMKFLTKELLKELNIDIQNDCNYISIFTFSSDKSIEVRSDDNNIKFKY